MKTALLLAGCSSSAASMPSIYILEASYQTGATVAAEQSSAPAPAAYLDYLANLTQHASLRVRGGFFGLCVMQPTVIQGQAYWDCANIPVLRSRYNDRADPLDLIGFIHTFVNKVVFYGLILGCLVLMCGVLIALSTFPGWHTVVDDDGSEHETKPFPSRPVSYAVTWASAWTVGFGLVSILWIHVGAVATAESIQISFGHLVKTSLGIAVFCLGWIAVALSAIILVGMIVMVLSIKLLDRLTAG